VFETAVLFGRQESPPPADNHRTIPGWDGDAYAGHDDAYCRFHLSERSTSAFSLVLKIRVPLETSNRELA
jgi:hypothetical protein